MSEMMRHDFGIVNACLASDLSMAGMNSFRQPICTTRAQSGGRFGTESGSSSSHDV